MRRFDVRVKLTATVWAESEFEAHCLLGHALLEGCRQEVPIVGCDRNVEITIQKKVAMPISFCARGPLHSAIRIRAKTIATSSRSRVKNWLWRWYEDDSCDRGTVSGTNENDTRNTTYKTPALAYRFVSGHDFTSCCQIGLGVPCRAGP